MFTLSSAAAARRSSIAFETAESSRSAFHSSSASLALALDLGIGCQDAAVGACGERRVLGSLEAVLADDLDLVRLDSRDALAVGLDQARLHVRDGFDGAALLFDDGHLGLGALDQLRDEPVHDLGALEDVRVLEEVGLEREDLLDAKAPLLVPGAGETHRLVPGRQLDRAGTGVAAKRHGQRLEDDALHVVLGLRLGQAERVDLDAVAHTKQLRIGDAVALAADLLPELGHRAELRVLLDEPDAGVDEERDAAEDLGEVVFGDLAALPSPRRGRRSRSRARRRSPGSASRLPPGGGTSRCWSGSSSGCR